MFLKHKSFFLFVIVFSINITGTLKSQSITSEKPTEKSGCLNLNIKLAGCNNCEKDTITLSQFNEAIGITALPDSCNEEQTIKIISFDLEIVGIRKIHFHGSIFKMFETNILNREGEIIFSNCLVAVNFINTSQLTKQRSVELYNGLGEKKIVANPKKIYIIKD
jgi:hypothetical protein